MKRLKKPKGFTLVEVIVAMAVTTIIIIAAANLFSSASRVITTLKSDANFDIACDATNVYVRNRLDALEKVSVCDINDSTAIAAAITACDDQADESGVTPANLDVRALAIKDGKLYDLGVVSSAGEVSSRAGSNDYAVFDTNYYAGAKLSIKLSSTVAGDEGEGEEGGGGDSVKWVQLSTQFLETDGDPANQPKTITFKFLNGSATLPATAKTDNYVIIYSVNNMSFLNP